MAKKQFCHNLESIVLFATLLYISTCHYYALNHLYNTIYDLLKQVDGTIFFNMWKYIFFTVQSSHVMIFVLGSLFHHKPPLTLGTLHGCDASLTLRGGTHSGGQSPKVDGPAPPHYVTRTTSHTRPAARRTPRRLTKLHALPTGLSSCRSRAGGRSDSCYVE